LELGERKSGHLTQTNCGYSVRSGLIGPREGIAAEQQGKKYSQGWGSNIEKGAGNFVVVI